MFDEQNLPPGLDQEDWNDLVAHREQIGKPMTDIAKKRMLRRLKVLHDSGENLTEVIDQTINSWGNRPWTNVWPVKRREQRPQAHQDYKPEPEPESRLSEEEAAANVRYLQDAINGTMKIKGGRNA